VYLRPTLGGELSRRGHCVYKGLGEAINEAAKLPENEPVARTKSEWALFVLMENPNNTGRHSRTRYRGGIDCGPISADGMKERSQFNPSGHLTSRNAGVADVLPNC